eukprot:3727963-Lingulodinium_polyedra.AAC.1
MDREMASAAWKSSPAEGRLESNGTHALVENASDCILNPDLGVHPAAQRLVAHAPVEPIQQLEQGMSVVVAGQGQSLEPHALRPAPPPGPPQH